MGWRFRTSFSPIPGVRLTLSPSGISTSVGAGPLRLTVGPRGPSVTAHIPGTGISYTQRLGVSTPASEPVFVPQPSLVPAAPGAYALDAPPNGGMTAVQSGGAATMTSPGLGAFKSLLERAQTERADIESQLVGARAADHKLGDRYYAWTNGWLFRRLFKKTYAKLGERAAEALARRKELEEQLSLSAVQTELDVPAAVSAAFSRMCDDFAKLAGSQKIWDTVSQRATNQLKERTTAQRMIERKLVRFDMKRCALIASEQPVPHLENDNGGDIFLYPLFALYFVTPQSFALIEYRDIKLTMAISHFQEVEKVPSDGQLDGYTWAKANRDGSRDQRYSNNYQIPIVLYGKLSFQSGGGLNEEYMISNAKTAEAFYRAWNGFTSTLTSGSAMAHA